MSRRILLADDSVTIQKVIELTFMDEDFAVTAASNGDEALAKLPEVQPDLVIADVHMPGANGYEVCRRAKASRPGLPVLLLVGTFEPFDEGEARAAGCDAHLKKPFDSQELLSLVHQLLERAPAAPAAAPAPALTIAAAPIAAPAAVAPTTPTTPIAAPHDDSAAGRSAGFDWAETSRFGRADEPTFELEDADEALGLDDSLLHDEPALGAGSAGGQHAATDHDLYALDDIPADAPAEHEHGAEGSAAAAARSFDEPFDLGAPSLAALASTEDHREDHHEDHLGEAPAREAPPAAGYPSPDVPSTWPPNFEERVGVPAGSAPLTSGLDEVGEHVLQAEERHEEPFAAAPSEPMAAVFAAPAPALAVGAAEVPAVPASAALSDDEVDRIARRIVELLGDKAIRDVAWEVIPDMAEVVIKDRLRELEGQAD